MASIASASISSSQLLAAPRAPKPGQEKYLPVHATLTATGRAAPREGCTQHGFVVVWNGVLEPVDDDPDGIFPAVIYEGDGPFATLKFDNWVCRQEGLDDHRVTYELGPKPTAYVSLFLAREDGTGKLDRRPVLEFHSFDLGYIHISDWGDSEPPGIGFEGSWGPGTIAPELAFTEEDFRRGFDCLYRPVGVGGGAEEGALGLLYSLQDEYEVEVTLRLSYKQDTEKPKVEIAGCAHLRPGDSERLTASGTPSGGRYRWSAEPASVLACSGSESSAEASAGSPGRATVRVEYTARNGKKAEATLPGSVVTLSSVNGGAPIPAIYRYDAYGNETPAIEVPTAQDPPDGDLLSFVVADPAIATVMNTGTSILIQGKSDGTTSAQAQTKCGEKTGPVITITVAGCDPESVARLREKYKETQSKLNESISRVHKVLTSDKFNKASSDIKDAIIDAAVDAADIATAGAAKVGAVKTIADVISLGARGWTTYRDGANTTIIKTAAVALFPGVGLAAVVTYEKINTWGTLIKHIDALIDADERIAQEVPIQKGLTKELEQIDRLIEKCKQEGGGGPPPPKEPPKPKPEPKPEPPGKKEPRPGDPEPPPPGEPPAPPEPVEPPSDKGEPRPPKPPEDPPPPKNGGAGIAGLPIECGCKDASIASWRSEKTGLASIAASLGLLKGCAESYAEAMRSFLADTVSIAETARGIEAAVEIPGERGFEVLSDAAAGLSAVQQTYEKLTKAAEEFRNTIEGCDEKMPVAVELIRKAGTPPETTAPGAKPR